MNNTIPHCNTKAKTHLPWISRELIRMQRRRNKSHKKAKQTGLNKHWEQFRELRRQTTKALATSYKSYVNNQIGDSLKTNPKRFWSFIKANKRENIGIPTLRVNDRPITDDRDKANALNNQFSSVFIRERYPIGQFHCHGHYISEIFGDFRSSFHIPASVKSQIIHSHYKAVIMDSASYEAEINFLNQL